MRSSWWRAASAATTVAFLTVAVIGLLTAAPTERDRATELERQLRCPVCTSVSIDESMSESAQVMRESVADQIAAGRTDQQIIDYFRARYGDWVLLDPPARGSTLLLWVLPPALAAVAALAVLLAARRSPDPAATPPQWARDRVAGDVARLRAAPDGGTEP